MSNKLWTWIKSLFQRKAEPEPKPTADSGKKDNESGPEKRKPQTYNLVVDGVHVKLLFNERGGKIAILQGYQKIDTLYPEDILMLSYPSGITTRYKVLEHHQPKTINTFWSVKCMFYPRGLL